MNDLNLFKKNGFLVKENLISQTKINKINKIVNEVISKEKKRKKGNGANGTQSYDNYHFVYNSGSSKNKEILRLNNPQNRHNVCLLYTSPSPRDAHESRMPSSA